MNIIKSTNRLPPRWCCVGRANSTFMDLIRELGCKEKCCLSCRKVKCFFRCPQTVLKKKCDYRRTFTGFVMENIMGRDINEPKRYMGRNIQSS